MARDTHVRLHAKPGLAALHIGEEPYRVGKDGTVEVHRDHVADALSMGCSTEPVVFDGGARKKPEAEFDVSAALARMKKLEDRCEAIEAAATQLADIVERLGGELAELKSKKK